MKLDKELLTKHAKRLQAILNEKSTFAPYIARPDFSKVLENSLNTLNAGEKELTKVQLAAKYSAKTLVKDFNKLGKNEFKLDEKFKYEDEGDLIDNINYLVTYCKNIFKVNLDSLLEGKQVTASNPAIDLRAKPEADDASAAYAGMAMGGMPMGDMAYGNPFVMGQAYAKVKTDIATGKLYTYNSKPRSVIFAKWAAIITIGLTAIALIVGAIFAILAKDLVVKYTDGEFRPMNFNAIGPGIMYMLIGLFGAYPMYQLIRGLNSKNDNYKYYFNWPWVLIFILMALLFVMPDMRITWLLSAESIQTKTGNAWNAFQNWKLMYIVALGCAGSCLIPMIIGAVCNPKQNKALLDQKLREYADQAMASGAGTPPGFGAPAAPKAADVQKPVEVKKPTKTKSKDKTKDKK